MTAAEIQLGYATKANQCDEMMMTANASTNIEDFSQHRHHGRENDFHDLTNEKILATSRRLVILYSQLCKADLRHELFEIYQASLDDKTSSRSRAYSDNTSQVPHTDGRSNSSCQETEAELNLLQEMTRQLVIFEDYTDADHPVCLKEAHGYIDEWRTQTTEANALIERATSVGEKLREENSQLEQKLAEAENVRNAFYGVFLIGVVVFFAGVGVLCSLVWAYKESAAALTGLLSFVWKFRSLD